MHKMLTVDMQTYKQEVFKEDVPESHMMEEFWDALNRVLERLKVDDGVEKQKIY